MRATGRHAAMVLVLVLALGIRAAWADEVMAPPPSREPKSGLRLPPRAVVRPVTPVDQTKAQLLATAPARQARPKDSLKNGTIIGAVAGGAYGVLVSALLHDELGSDGVTGVLMTTTATGAGIGLLIDWLH